MIYSFSRLTLYETCPNRFFKKYIEGFEEPATKPLALGKAVHRTVEGKLKGETHSEAVLNGMIESDFHREVTYDEVSKLASRAPIKKDMGEVELHFELPLASTEPAPKIQGYIDLITWNSNEIIDWKTNQRMYNVRDNHQIGLYAWAVSQLKGKEKIKGSLFFLRFRKASRWTFTNIEMEQSRQWALSLANEIDQKLFLYEIAPEKADALFPDKPSSFCSHCPFAVECFQKFSMFNPG